MSEENSGSLEHISKSIGATEPALKLLISLLSGYPLALLHRQFLYGHSPKLQHLYFILTGFSLGYFNYGTEIFHAVFAVIFSYLTLVILRGTSTCVAITFIFNMSYLLIGYYYSATNDYDINWTLPQCVLVLRLIGLSYDLYDGNQPEETLSDKNKEVALQKRPSLMEYCGHMFFPVCFLVGPQFPMKRYQDFIAGDFSDPDDKTKPPQCIQPAIRRFLLGVMYLTIFQVVSFVLTDDYIISDEFFEITFWKRWVFIGIWCRVNLYKYMSCWLLTEGACIMFGLTHNGKNANGEVKWDGLANVDIYRFENATEFNHYIQSFNTNTNHWVAQYVYKRLKFLGNRFMSQGAALLFLAVWHGFHSGYYICFFFEFMVMYLEKDVHDIFNKNPHLKTYFESSLMKSLVYVCLKIYTFIFMGWCFVPFVLLTFDKFWKGYSALNFIGIIFFVPYPFIYGPILRLIAKTTRPKINVD